MKKIILTLCIIVGIVIIIPEESKDFRIRVIANSDSIEDQNLKMKVVNAIKDEIKKYDIDNIESEVKKNIKNIDKVVSNVLKNREYTIDVRNLRFPPKELNGEVVKGGKYKTLIVEIEEAKGKNWWSLLSPNFNKGFEDASTGDVEFKFYFFEELKKSFK